MISLTLLSIVLFGGTNIDDLLLLLSFFADHAVPRSAIVVGQYIGFTVLVLVSLLCSEVAVILPPLGLRLLGIIPIAIGLCKVSALFRTSDAESSDIHPATTRSRHIWHV